MYLLLERVAMQPARCWERSAQIYWPPTVAVSVIASESPACVFQRGAGSKSKASGLYREYNQGGVAGKRVGCLADFFKSGLSRNLTENGSGPRIAATALPTPALHRLILDVARALVNRRRCHQRLRPGPCREHGVGEAKKSEQNTPNHH